MVLSDGKTEIPKFCIAQINYSYAGNEFLQMDKIAIHQFWIGKNIFTTRLPIRRSRSGSQSWSGAGEPGQGNLILSHPPFLFKVAFLNSGDSCETFSNPFFQKKKPSENESNCEVWLARAGLGAVALSSTAAPVLAPLSLKATPRPPYIWSTQPNFPLLGRQEAPRPKCVACHRCTQLHLDLPNPPSPAPRPA